MNLFVSAKKFVLHLTVLLFVFCSFALTVPSVVLASQTSFVTAQYTVADATSDSFSNAEILDLIDGQISDLRLEKEKIAQEVASYGKQVKGTTDLKIDAAKAKLKDINAQINAQSKSLVGK